MMIKDKVREENIIQIDENEITLSECIDQIDKLLEAVYEAASDYYHSTPIINLFDEVGNGEATEVQFYIPIDLKTLGVIAAISQAPLALRGSSDCGKTAFSQRLLSGLFGPDGCDWWQMEINRGLTVDDLIDVEKLLQNIKSSEYDTGKILEGAEWLNKAGRLLDEINRAHPKLLNLLLHLADGSGFHIHGDLFLPVGQPYRINGDTKRFSFSVTTANQMDREYAGVFEEDIALTRRIVLSVDLDELPPSHRDISQMLANRRAKTFLRITEPQTKQIITIYEALAETVPFSALGHLFLHYLSGLNTCVQSRSGRIQPQLKSEICKKCHLAKSHRFCGRVGGLSEGLLLCAKDLATAIAAVRATMVLNQTRRICVEPDRSFPAMTKLQRLLGTKAVGDKLYDKFRRFYLEQLRVTGEDVKAAFILIAPTHVWIDSVWLKNQADFEGKAFYVFREVAREGWDSMLRFLNDHHNLVERLSNNTYISPCDQSEVEKYVTTENPAILAMISALRGEDLPLSFRDELSIKSKSTVAQ